MKIETFIKPGMLHVRQMRYPDGQHYETMLAYFTGEGRWCGHLARLRGGETRSEGWGRWLECVEDTADRSGDGNYIFLSDATDHDIRVFMQAWHGPGKFERNEPTLAEWVAQLHNRPNLSPVEVERIQRIVKALRPAMDPSVAEALNSGDGVYRP